jgi:hypothetical protein
VLRWPDRDVVLAATRAWAAEVGSHHHVVRVGGFGSLVSGNWGVGSDADLIVLVDESSDPPFRRALAFDASALPVPADVVVYTLEEWNRATTAGREPLGPVEWLAG